MNGKIDIVLDVKISEARVAESDEDLDLSEYTNVDEGWVKETYPKLKEGARFVEIMPLYETVSRNKFVYDANAIEQFNSLVIGRNGYLGHESFSQRFDGGGYRQPVARYIASAKEAVLSEGKTVQASKVLAYISRTSAGDDLYNNIVEGIAGNVSIAANGEVVENTDGSRRIKKFTEVESIDFVNNHTESVRGAGVTRIVKEQFTENEGSNASAPSNQEGIMDDITYDKLVESAAGREVETRIKESARAEVAETHEAAINEAVEAAKAEVTAELEGKLNEVRESNKKLEDENLTLRKQVAIGDLRIYRDEVFAQLTEAAKGEAQREGTEYDGRILEMAKARIGDDVGAHYTDGDFDASKASLKKAIDDEVATLTEMAKSFGAAVQESTDTSVTRDGSKGGTSGGVTFESIFPSANTAADKS